MFDNIMKVGFILQRSRCILTGIWYTLKDIRYRICFLTIHFLVFSFSGYATIYHVASEGGNFKTIAQVNAVSFEPGDKILFKKGETFIGTLLCNASGTADNPVTYGAYGKGANPIISGFTTIESGWKDEGGGIYSKDLSAESTPQMVTIDGVQYAMGRWPNTDWQSITKVTGTGQITDSELTGEPNWTGAKIVIKTTRWSIEKRTITNQSTNILTFSSTSYNPKKGWGYFIQNSLRTLDSYGEWYYDTDKGTFYMYFGAINPITKIVKVSTINEGIVSLDTEYITIDGLDIRGMNTQSIFLYPTPENVIIQNCNIWYSGGNGIYMHYPVNCSVLNSTFNFTNHCAIWFSDKGTGNNLISGNTIQNTGLIVGTGGTDNGSYNAIVCSRSNSKIEHNSITNTGYIPIRFGGKNTLVKNNFIDSFCSVLDDGAGIYCYADTAIGKRVINNIILNAVGVTSGTGSSTTQAYGLYSDGFSKHILYRGNTIAYISNFGFHSNIPKVMNIILTNNLFFQANSLVSLQRWLSGFTSGFTFTRNIYVTTTLNPELGMFNYNVDMNGQDLPFYNGSLIDEVAHLGVIDSNYYYTDIDKAALIYSSAPKAVSINYLNRNWQNTFVYDYNSRFVTGTHISSYYKFEYNGTSNSKIIKLNTPMIDVKGTKYVGSITIQPYTSVILMKDLQFN